MRFGTVRPGENARPPDEQRVIVVAPSGRDAALICGVLTKAGFICLHAPDPNAALRLITEAAGALLIAEEALMPSAVAEVALYLRDQPGWSDLPVIVLTVAGEVSVWTQNRRFSRGPLGNVQLLERPVRPETLISTVESALRARRRQYQVRDQMEQQRKAEDALRKSEKLAVAGRMAASIAHEINNPLESVTNLLYLIHHSESLEETRNYAILAERELARVTEIATQTLRFYRQPSKPTEVDLGEVLDSVLKLYHARLVAAGIEVEREFEPVAPIVGLSGELRQLFANLIANALDAMRAGGRLRVRVRPAVEYGNDRRSGVRISIADTGTGIPPRVRQRIYEPFITTKESTGTGLGLWVSSEILQKHGGSMRVKTRFGGADTGTVFTVFLPRHGKRSARREAEAS